MLIEMVVDYVKRYPTEAPSRSDPLAVELFLRASPATRREVAHRFLRGGPVNLLAEKIVKFKRYER